MEPLTTAAIALATVIATKALEKTGENVGDVLWNKSSEFLASLREHSPNTVVAIEKAPEKPLDYGEALLEIESTAQANIKIAQSMQELVDLAEKNSLPNFPEIIKEIEETVKKYQHSYPESFIQNIQKAINVAETQTIDQRGATFNIWLLEKSQQVKPIQKSFWWLIISLCLLSIPIGFHLFPQNLTPENQLIKEGRELLNNQEFELAEEKFNEAKKLAPKLAAPWYWIAKVSLARQNLPVADFYVEKALQLQANHEPSLVLQIKILLLKGGTDTEEAKRKSKESYGVSDSLDKWFTCLENNNIFSDIVNTKSKLDELCPSPKTPYQVN